MAESEVDDGAIEGSVCGRVVLRCRRGRRELDLMLTRFVEAHYSSLSAGEKRCFDRLLDQQDPVLAAWLFGQTRPDDGQLARLVCKIRQTFVH